MLAVFASFRVQPGSRDKEGLYLKTRTVPGIHFLLHEDSRTRSSRIRHAELFQGVAAIGASDGADLGIERLHRAGSGPRALDSAADPARGTARSGIGSLHVCMYSSLRNCFRAAGFWLATYPASSY